jgi:hypothetical protein
MMGIHGVVVLAALAGCTSVKLAQRDGCWVRRTEKLGTVKEELGPCTRPESPWAQDRLTRLVQECVAGADYRWRSRALVAWSRGERLPDRDPEASVLQECMSESARATVTDNEKLSQRLAEVSGDREALRAREEADRSRQGQTLDKLADYLGEAAKKTAAPATATATASSEGRLRSEGSSAAPAPAPAPAPVAIVNAAPFATPACAEASKIPGSRRARSGRTGPACPPSPSAGQVAATPVAPPAAAGSGSAAQPQVDAAAGGAH